MVIQSSLKTPNYYIKGEFTAIIDTKTTVCTLHKIEKNGLGPSVNLPDYERVLVKNVRYNDGSQKEITEGFKYAERRNNDIVINAIVYDVKNNSVIKELRFCAEYKSLKYYVWKYFESRGFDLANMFSGMPEEGTEEYALIEQAILSKFSTDDNVDKDSIRLLNRRAFLSEFEDCGNYNVSKVSVRDFMDTYSLKKLKNRKIIVKGHVQSGKTMFIIANAFNFLFQGISVLIVLRNSIKDKQQIESRLKAVFKDLRDYVPECYKNKFDINFLQEGKAKVEDLSKPSLYISLGNNTALEKYANLIEYTNRQFEFAMFIDEADFLDSTDTKLQIQLERIKPNAYCSFDISATILDQLLNDDIKEGNVLCVSKPADYKGIPTFTPYTLLNENSLSSKITDDVFEKAQDFKEYIQSMNKRSMKKYMTMGGEFHPIISLARVATALEPNFKVLSYMKENYPAIPSMFFCGEGVYLSISGYEEIQLYNKDVSEPKKGFLLFKKSAPGDVLTWLYENGGVVNYPRIFICAGDLAARGISFGASNFTECKMQNKLWWHLTEMYICASDSTDQPELLQLAGRLAGIYNDNIALRLYAVKKVYTDIIKAYWLQEELIKRANETFSKSSMKNLENPSFGQIIQNMPIFADKIVSRSLTKRETEYKLENVTTDAKKEARAGGWNMDECYRYLDNPMRAVFSKVKEELKKKVPKAKASKSVNDAIAKLEEWKNQGDRKMATFLNSLNELVNKSFTKNELKKNNQGCSEDLVNELNKYKIILKGSNGKYRFNEDIKDSFIEIFP
jgi:hypothetical protein